MSKALLPRVIIYNIMNQLVLNYHPSRIVNSQDLERAIDTHPFLNVISEGWDLNQKAKDVKQIRNIVSNYKQYVFTTDALNYLQTFLDLFGENYEDKETLLDKFPLFKEEIENLYMRPKKPKVVKFQPNSIDIDMNTTLYHTTNAFEIFEQNGNGKTGYTPYGVSWFNIDSIYPPENIFEFHPNRGPMRVIKYKWLGSHANVDIVRSTAIGSGGSGSGGSGSGGSGSLNEKKSSRRLTKSYPFLGSDSMKKSLHPVIMDARKIHTIPRETIENYLVEKGLVANPTTNIGVDNILPEIDHGKNILEQYGFTWKPIIVEYLKSLGFDGILVVNNELVLFEPEKWLFFDGIEQSDNMYLAIVELMKNYVENKNLYSDPMTLFYQLIQSAERPLPSGRKIPNIASKYNLDKKSLEIIFMKNKKYLD